VLLEIVTGLATMEQQRERTFPTDAARLSTRLRRIAPAMRRTGWDVVLPMGGGRAGRTATIEPTLAGRARQDAGAYLCDRRGRGGTLAPAGTLGTLAPHCWG